MYSILGFKTAKIKFTVFSPPLNCDHQAIIGKKKKKKKLNNSLSLFYHFGLSSVTVHN